MGRPAMNFNDDDAERICAGMRRHLYSVEWPMKNLAFPASASSWAERDAFERSAAAGLREIDALLQPGAERRPGEVAEMMRKWIQLYVTPAGWRRYQDAERQRRSKKTRRSTQMALDEATSILLGKLAQEVGLDKRAVLSRLLEHLTYDSHAGLEARRHFADTVRSQQGAAGTKMLGRAFGLDWKQVLSACLTLDRQSRPEDAAPGWEPPDWGLLAFRVGLVRLRELAASASQEGDPSHRLRATLLRLRELQARSTEGDSR